MARAPEWIVEVAPSRGDGTWDDWRLCWPAVAGDVVHYTGARPSTASLSLQGLLWHEQGGLAIDDRVCIRTPGPLAASTVLFDGVITAWQPSFSGGMAGAEGYEKSTFVAQDMRYLIHITSKIKGQISRSAGDYPARTHPNWNQSDPPAAIGDGCVWNAGRRCVFNEHGQPNKDTEPVTGPELAFAIPLFGSLNRGYWSLAEIVQYIFSEWVCLAVGRGYAPQTDPAALVGLSDPAWATIVPDVVLEGLSSVEAAEYLAALIGWKYRLDDYYEAGTIKQRHVFYQPSAAAGQLRSAAQPALRHWLYAPNNYDALYPTTAAIQELRANPGLNLVWQGDLLFDASAAANVSVGLGERDTYEITAELVPAWPDSLLDLAWVDRDPEHYEEDPLFLLDEDLKEILEAGEDPDSRTYFKRYCDKGSEFWLYGLVGRKWALNEVGTYSVSAYDRGGPFDFTTVIPALTASLLGYAPRQVLPCLTQLDAEGNKINYRLEFTVDGGANWHPFEGRYQPLTGDNYHEWGIYITQPNLADITIKSKTDEGENLAYPNESGAGPKTYGLEINFWTAVAREIDASRSFKDGQWQLKVRLTACVQLDQRLVTVRDAIAGSGTCFRHESVFDYSRQYKSRTRTASSVLGQGAGAPAADQADERVALAAHLDLVTEINRQQSHSCSFSLLGIKPAEGSGVWRMPRFVLGDTIAGIEGRGVSLRTNQGADREEFVSIEQIIYSPESDLMSIVTSDLRKSRVQ